jgi:hypothetical protein
MLTDQFLINNERGIGEGHTYKVALSTSTHFFLAPNKKEATRIAREYGFRFKNGARVLGVEKVEMRED